MLLKNETFRVWIYCAFFLLSILSYSHASGLLTIVPEEDFLIAGPDGGPFSPIQKEYTLTNSGDAGLYWGGEIEVNWLDMQPEWGQLDPNESIVVTLFILPAAESLPGGVYNDTAVFTDITNNNQISRQVQLTITAAEGVLEVTPLQDWIASGEPGGPFTPAYQDYTLTNIGGSNLYWGIDLSTAWLTAGDSFGSLDPNQTVMVRISLNAQADSLGEGDYPSTIGFNNLSTSQPTITRTSILHIENIGGIWVSPEQLITELTERTTKLNTLTVGNDSSSLYSFTLRTRVVAGTAGPLSSPVIQDDLSSGLDFSVPQSTEFHPGRILVRFKKQIQAAPDFSAQKTQITASLGGTIQSDISLVPGLSVVQLPAGMTVQEALTAYNASDDVLYAQPDYMVHADATWPNDPRFSEQWALHNTGQTGGASDADIDAPEAWDINTGDHSVVVAVIDTGVDYTHPDLAGNMWINQAEYTGTSGVDDDGNGYIDDIYGYDFCNNDPDPRDDHYHGTHCAGIIGAVGNNGIGVSGACWTVKIMSVKFLDSGGGGWTSDAIECVQYATKMNVKVMSNSWGGGSYDQALKDAIDAAKAKGILFVAAAGNDGSNNDSYPHYPSNYTSENVISVMATTNTDAKASFSNYGLTTVDIGAPGETILSTAPANTYRTLSGTSMAAPYVSGACCLLWAADPYLSWQEVKNILMQTVDPTLANKCVSGGRLNLQKAIQEIRVPWLNLDVEEGTLNPGQSIPVGVTVDASQLTPGLYRAEIILLSSDPLHPSTIIPVEVTVTKDSLEIQPTSAFESEGVEGGPFNPASMTYTLENTGLQAIEWAVNSPASWLDIQPSAGSLDPAQSVQILVSLKQDVLLFAPDIYTGSLSFQNVTCGSIQTKQAFLTVRCPDKLTESFTSNDNDLSYSSLTFMPENSRAHYRLCLDPNSMTSLPFDPAQATYVPLGDDDYAEIFFADGKEFFFFGQYYSTVFIGSNGYLTFGEGDLEYENTLQNHFSLPRIAGLFADLTPTDSRRIAYQQTGNSFIVTYNNVPLYGDKTETISFQIELFFNDGYIQLRYLNNQQFNGITGLSDGTGFVASSQESNFTGYKKCCECGDITGDSAITLEDLQVFASSWLTTGCGIPQWCEFADMNKDTTVDLSDMNRLSQNWGQAAYVWSNPQFCLDLNHKSWTSPQFLSELNDSQGNKAKLVRLSRDKLHLFWTRYIPSLGCSTNIQANRNSPDEPFTTQRILSELAVSGLDVGGSWISEDNQRLYYHQVVAGGGYTLKMAVWSSATQQWIPTKTFTELESLSYYNSAPSLTADELTIFWQSNRPDGLGLWDTWTASRPSVEVPFGNIRNLSEINSTNSDGGPSVLPDGLTLYFYSANRPGYLSVTNIYKVTRNNLSVPFSNIEVIDFPTYSQTNESQPNISYDEKTLYYSDDLATGCYVTYNQPLSNSYAADAPCVSSDSQTIYYERYIPKQSKTCILQSTITDSPAGFENEKFLDELNPTAVSVGSPWISQDSLRLYYTESDPNSEGTIEMAQRPDPNSPWTITKSFPELNGNGSSAGPALTEDELTIVYETNRTTPDYAGYWKFSEGTGSTTQDSSSYGRSGQIYGSAAWTTGYADSCLSFDGVDDYAKIPDYNGISGSNPRTVSVWFKTSSPVWQSGGTMPYNLPFVQWGHWETGKMWMVYLMPDRKACVGVTGGRVISSTALNDGLWHNLIAVLPEGKNKSEDILLYVDGRLDFNPDNSCIINTNTENMPVHIGVLWDFSTGTPANACFAQGLIDEVCIYDRALSEAEIQALAAYPLNSTLWTAGRASTSDAFSNIQPLDELNSQYKQTQPTLSPDGLTIYFSSNRENGQTWNIYKATRSALDAPFTLEGILPAANNLSKDGSPFVSADGQLIYFYKETSTQKGLWVSQWKQADKPCEPK